MKQISIFFAMLLALAGCTAGDVSVIREVTVDDGAAYIRENHDWRSEIREMQRAMVRETLAIKKTQCQAFMMEQRFDEAIACLGEADLLFTRAYPRLATIELLKEGAESIQELRAVFRSAAPPTE